MVSFRTVSIQKKLIAIAMLSSTTALLLACASFGAYEVVMFRGDMTRDLATLAGIVGANSTAALSFEDRKAATENLAGLAAKRGIVAACIFDLRGRVFARYSRDGRNFKLPSAPGAEGGRFVGGGLRLEAPILLDREKIGSIFIESDLQEMYSRLEVYAAILSLVFLAAWSLTLLLSSRLQRLISAPILELTRVTDRIATKADYSVRATLQTPDEFGRLATSFNKMATQLERSQRESEEYARRMAEAQRIARIGSWEWDVAANRVLWSEELYTIFGIAQREFGGTYEAYLACVHPDDRPAVRANVERALHEKSFPVFVHRTLRDGEERFVQASGLVLTDASGQAIRMTGVAQDVTEDKQMERDLKLARDAALDSARMKSEFLANMSHEIRTPMNGVIGMTELLLDTGLSETQREYTEAVRTSADSLLGIISDILDFSKIEAGKLHFEWIAFDPRGAAEAAVDLLAERAGAKGVELRLLIDEEIPALVCGDPGRLQQVLNNLVSNAVKFTTAGEVTVRGKRQAETDSHVTLFFSVRDTGVGLSDAAKRTLFQPFSQGDGSTTRQYGGTGLGLVICKQLVELMGGEIGLESDVGRGSIFWFTVRLEKSAQDGPATALPVREELRGLRVLVVDDNAINRKILMRQTAAWGMLPTETEAAAAGLQALREASAQGSPYHFALLDLDMPLMNGLELGRAIRSEPGLAATRLVLMPSSSDREVARAARAAGIDACLRKPVRRVQLFDAMARILRQPAAAKPRAADTSAEIEAAPADVRALTAPPDTRTRVLIAEDNLINQTLAAVQLRTLGYRSGVAANGREALATLFRAAYDIVLMDCQMPEMDGYEATREIRRREGPERHTVIIAMTANSMEGDRDKCLAAGMDDYLSKPVKMEDLRRTLDRWRPDRQSVPAAARAALAPVSEEVLDASVLDGLRALQDLSAPDLLKNLIGLFLVDTPSRLQAVREAVEHQQSLVLARLAHALKGASANLGVRSMTQTCGQLEELGRADEIRGAPVLVARLETEFDQVCVLFRTMAGLSG